MQFWRSTDIFKHYFFCFRDIGHAHERELSFIEKFIKFLNAVPVLALAKKMRVVHAIAHVS